MYAQREKPKGNKSRAVADSVGQKKSNLKQDFGFVDNRPEAVAQRKLQEITNNSSQDNQAAQLEVNFLSSTSIIQFGPIKKQWKQNRKRNINPARRRPGVKKAKWLREYESKVQAVKTFMEKQVAPWATQARISELINENMVDMRKDETISSEMTYLNPSKRRINDLEYTPQIAPGESRFLAPSRSEGREEGGKTVIHRGDLEIEMNGKEPCVRVYSALWAEARPNKEGKVTHKDIHQDPESGKIIIHTGRDQDEVSEEDDKNPIMWVSGGQPLRQLKWFYKYLVEKDNPGAKPVVRSFLAPLSVWNDISSQAVNEESAKKKGNEERPFNVDTTYGANQFGVRGPMLEKLRKCAVSKSLISYTGDQSHSLDKFGGKVVGIKRLHNKLGAPLTDAPMPVWVDTEQGKFVRTAKQQSLANTLMFYYGIWTGNREFIPDDKAKIPKEKLHSIFNDFLAQHKLELPKGYRLP